MTDNEIKQVRARKTDIPTLYIQVVDCTKRLFRRLQPRERSTSSYRPICIYRHSRPTNTASGVCISDPIIESFKHYTPYCEYRLKYPFY